jgi:preprotein translocase subunit Sss1
VRLYILLSAFSGIIGYCLFGGVGFVVGLIVIFYLAILCEVIMEG